MNAYIPNIFFCGMPARRQHTQKEDELLAFITPDGDDAAAKKRKQTVKEWCEGWRAKKETGKYWTFLNSPQSGFKLKQCKTRYSTSNKVWRVEDPRGFEIEIYSDNFMDILENGTISKGNFVGEFVYGRDGQKNTLIPIGSQMHVDALAYTISKAAPAGNAKDLVIGDRVQIRRFGALETLIYCGRFYELKTSANPKPVMHDYSRGYIHRQQSESEREFIYYDSVSKTKGHYFMDEFGAFTGPVHKVNFIKVVEKNALEKADLQFKQKFKTYHSGRSIWNGIDKLRVIGVVDENRKFLVGLRNQRVELGMSITNDDK